MHNDAAKRFDQIVSNYATSEVHVNSPSIQRLHTLLSEPKLAAVCDVACGPGHLGLSFSEKAQRIVGVDPSPQMLATFRQLAATRKIEVEIVEAYSEAIPLPDASFDLVMSRLAPHHFADVASAIAEMVRITRVGGHVAVIDLEGDPDPKVDAFNHRLECLHDPTHVRSYTAEQWRTSFQDAGLRVVALENKLTERPGGVTVRRWCEIAASGPQAQAEIQNVLSEAPRTLLDALGIVSDGQGEFRLPVRTCLIVGQKTRQ